MCVHAEAKGQPLVYFLRNHLSFKTIQSLTELWGSLVRLGWLTLTTVEPQGCAHRYHPGARGIGICHHICIFR